MFKCLSPSAIGIRGLSLPQVIDLARESGFEGVEFSIGAAAALADERGIDYVRGLFERAGVRPGTWGLPVAWNDEARWEQDLAQLPRLAALAHDLGCPRTATWCPPGSDERPYVENFSWHTARFQAIAEVLVNHGCRLGLEFIGPATARAKARYPFIYTLEDMMVLVVAIRQRVESDNVGLLLDVWHLHTSGGSAADLDTITADDVVLVHVNDAPAGILRDEQMDLVRCLPMETGIIDAPAMLRRLAAMGYDGPVMPEPFSQRVNEAAEEYPLKAARMAAQAMDTLWRASGLT